jgi:hypothetical protein
VLDDVGHVDLRPVDAGRLHRAVEQPARRPDERLTGQVLTIARLLANEHQPRVARAIAEDRLRGVGVETAAAALLRRRAQRRQRLSGGKEVARRAGAGVVGRRFGRFGVCHPFVTFVPGGWRARLKE